MCSDVHLHISLAAKIISVVQFPVSVNVTATTQRGFTRPFGPDVVEIKVRVSPHEELNS